MQKIKEVEQQYLKSDIPAFNVGDTIEIETIIREGDKQRIQKFKGLVIAIDGSGISKMVTLRKISYGIGVEKKLPLHSTNVGKIKVLKTGNVRRSKLYYLRDRVGKMALKVRAGQPIPVIENEEQVVTEDDIEMVPMEGENQSEVQVDAPVQAEAAVETEVQPEATEATEEKAA